MQNLVRKVREVKLLLGSYDKGMQTCENEIAVNLKRSCTLISSLEKGGIITKENITWTRPGGGIPPDMTSEIVGKRINRSLHSGDQISFEYLE
jgi:N-acetylneuraminate synthase/N,N'-diacetyllegionaminate synthase